MFLILVLITKERLRTKIITRLQQEGSNADEPTNIELSDYSRFVLNYNVAAFKELSSSLEKRVGYKAFCYRVNVLINKLSFCKKIILYENTILTVYVFS